MPTNIHNQLVNQREGQTTLLLFLHDEFLNVVKFQREEQTRHGRDLDSSIPREYILLIEEVRTSEVKWSEVECVDLTCNPNITISSKNDVNSPGKTDVMLQREQESKRRRKKNEDDLRKSFDE